MIVVIVAVLLACVQAITAGYYLVRAVDDPAVRPGSLIFAALASACAGFLFTVAVMHYEPA